MHGCVYHLVYVQHHGDSIVFEPAEPAARPVELPFVYRQVPGDNGYAFEYISSFQEFNEYHEVRQQSSKPL